MIRHIVLTRFRPDVAEKTITDIYAGLAQVAENLPGAGRFVGGRSTSPEQIERGYMHGFTIDFDSWAEACYPRSAKYVEPLTALSVC